MPLSWCSEAEIVVQHHGIVVVLLLCYKRSCGLRLGFIGFHVESLWGIKNDDAMGVCETSPRVMDLRSNDSVETT